MTRRDGLGLAVLAAVGLLIFAAVRSHMRADPVPKWCRGQVHLGESFASLQMPGRPHLQSVSQGVWKYDDGVVVTIVDGQVYDKQCA